uniref:Uncharacterized protein n=1 Tax=Arundo donax TaxID=35708 RepID=A0A0A8YIA7_ARUDO
MLLRTIVACVSSGGAYEVSVGMCGLVIMEKQQGWHGGCYSLTTEVAAHESV